MEIDPTKLKAAYVELLKNLKMLETELTAYQFVIDLATKTGLVDPAIPWKESLEGARQNPLLVKLMADKYDPFLAAIERVLDQKAGEDQLVELLRKWKPSGPLN